jgi:hypothetical protein
MKTLISAVWTKIRHPKHSEVADTLEGWREYSMKMEKNYPIRYFLFDTLPFWISCKYKWWITEPWYRFRCAVWNRYNVVKIQTLDPTWSDVVCKMLHVNFQLLVEYIEGEKPFDRIDWDATEDHKHAAAEMKELYRWWKEDYPRQDEMFPDGTLLRKSEEGDRIPMWKLFGESYRDEPEIIEYKKVLDDYNKNERAWVEEEERQLIRLMKIRPYLWT